MANTVKEFCKGFKSAVASASNLTETEALKLSLRNALHAGVINVPTMSGLLSKVEGREVEIHHASKG